MLQVLACLFFAANLTKYKYLNIWKETDVAFPRDVKLDMVSNLKFLNVLKSVILCDIRLA